MGASILGLPHELRLAGRPAWVSFTLSAGWTGAVPVFPNPKPPVKRVSTVELHCLLRRPAIMFLQSIHGGQNVSFNQLVIAKLSRFQAILASISLFYACLGLDLLSIRVVAQNTGFPIRGRPRKKN